MEVFSSADTDSRWVGDLITVNAVNVNSSCFKCPLLGEEKNCLRGCPTTSGFFMIDVYRVTYEARKTLDYSKKAYS